MTPKPPWPGDDVGAFRREGRYHQQTISHLTGEVAALRRKEASLKAQAAELTRRIKVAHDSPHPAVVYLLERVDGLIKIGTSTNFPSRHKWLRSQHGRLQTLLLIEGSHPLERTLHRQFAHLRAEGEWFRPGRDLLDWISSHEKAA